MGSYYLKHSTQHLITKTCREEYHLQPGGNEILLTFDIPVFRTKKSSSLFSSTFPRTARSRFLHFSARPLGPGDPLGLRVNYPEEPPELGNGGGWLLAECLLVLPPTPHPHYKHTGQHRVLLIAGPRHNKNCVTRVKPHRLKNVAGMTPGEELRGWAVLSAFFHCDQVYSLPACWLWRGDKNITNSLFTILTPPLTIIVWCNDTEILWNGYQTWHSHQIMVCCTSRPLDYP